MSLNKRSITQAFAFAFVVLSAQSMISAEPDKPSSDELTFERHIRPILREYCLDCHGATEQKEGNLDLRLVRFMSKGGIPVQLSH